MTASTPSRAASVSTKKSSLLYWFWPSGLFTMIGRMIQFVVDVQRTITDFTLLLTSPSSIMAAIGLFLQFGAAALLAIVVPITVRSLVLPSSIESTVPLNLVFDACEDQIHAICSFPTATLHVQENTIFSPNVYYALNVKLQFAEVESTKKLGLFQNLLRVYDDEDRLMREYSRTSYIREPSVIRKATWMFFFPLYLTGFFTTAAQLDIPLTAEHFENPSSPTSKIFFQLQNRFAEVESADLSVVAQFGLVRHLLYYYPMMTFTMLWLPTFLTLSLLLFLNWGLRVTREVAVAVKAPESAELVAADNGRGEQRRAIERTPIREPIIEEEEREDEQLTPSSSRSSTVSFEEVHRPEESLRRDTVKACDEFIPDNVEELPECAPPFLIDGLTSLTPVTSTVIPLEYGSEKGPRKRR
ncbi:hypothetical protein PMAYCL1PPCAC_30023 [Pristionchus mayeri]|uniref:Seipin n=1 Tax=Pristionchus mayeri TaxID=1317129 RepID=A0AAN5DB30_9BILA|nr:hypothetical protein PMAYCL1PPCAC_30023 [Pristionchus mayeri]